MPLANLEPLSFRRFEETLGNVPSHLATVLEHRCAGGWAGALGRYRFGDSTHVEGVRVRDEFNARLRSAATPSERCEVATDILRWGRMKPMPGMAQWLESALDLLEHERTSELDRLPADRIASVSKIYEMWDPSKWIIYDSYCARGFQWVVSQYWDSIGCRRFEGFLKLPLPPGRSGRPVEGFPRVGTARQARLGFLYGSWLSRLLAIALNRSRAGGVEWSAFHVEMAAFQLGHEV